MKSNREDEPKRPRGRPKTTVPKNRFTCYITKELIEKIKVAAFTKRMNIGEFCETALTEYINEIEKKDGPFPKRD